MIDADKFDVVQYAVENISEMNEMPELIDHSIVVSNISRLIAKKMGMDEKFCNDIAITGLVHDIGKIPVYFAIYGKNHNKLNVEKMRFIRSHSKVGYDILQDVGFSEDICKAVLHHHENYDGSGYPNNLRGEEIPLAARIIRVSDTFAALTSDRTYRKAFDPNTAVKLMIDEVKNFDMEIFLKFLDIINTVDIKEITGKEE